MENIRKILRPYKGLPKGIYILFIARIINCLGNFVFPLMSLILTEKIGLSKAGAGTFVTVFAVTQVPSMLIGGKLSDSIGRKKTIVIFQSLGIICYIICGFLKPSMSVALMIVAAADFYSVASPSLDALNADITTPENRKGSYSLLYMGFNIGFAVSPIIGGMLYKNYLPVIFIGDALTTLLSTILIIIFIKEPVKNKLPENENKLEMSEEGSVLSVLIKRPILLYFAVIMFIYQFAYAQWGFTLPLQMADTFKGDGARLYGMVAGLNGVVVIIFTPVITVLIRKMKPLNAISLGGIFYMAAFGSLGFINSLSMFFISIFIMTLGEIMISINNGTFVADHTPASHRGRVNSIIPIITGAGYAVGPMIMGHVVSRSGYTVTWTIIAAGMLFGAACMKLLGRVEKE